MIKFNIYFYLFGSHDKFKVVFCTGSLLCMLLFQFSPFIVCSRPHLVWRMKAGLGIDILWHQTIGNSFPFPTCLILLFFLLPVPVPFPFFLFFPHPFFLLHCLWLRPTTDTPTLRSPALHPPICEQLGTNFPERPQSTSLYRSNLLR